jgi:hypothetical protein
LKNSIASHLEKYNALNVEASPSIEVQMSYNSEEFGIEGNFLIEHL